ncbi:CPBP family intramembrane glutamic endopeptidase [Streptococcus minor]|uniref:CPBP family intramembrane glutamic endopeptidase n=1 Tax=Streptococcus minor TaxID=229549 RepID=UPI00036BFD59|nr:CPBP family intramembrane glutamic endopeptidase [Streptococcus minor]
MSTIRNYILLSYGLTWWIWLVIWLFGIQLGEPISQIGTVVAMWIPALSYFIVKKWQPEQYQLRADFRLHFKKNWKYYLLAMWGPTILTCFGASLYFLIFKNQFSLHFKGLEQMLPNTGQKLIAVPLKVVAMVQIISSMTFAPLLNTFFALGEEIGWRGYLYPALRTKFPTLQSHLLTGIIWSFWHFPLNLQGYNFGLAYWGAPWLGLVAMFVFCFSIGVFLSFVMEKTGSLWAPALLHGAVNASAGIGILFQVPSDQALAMRFLGPSPVGLLAGLPILMVAFLILFKRKDSQR